LNARKWDPFARKKRYLLEPRVLRRIAKEAAALPVSVKEKNAYIIQELAKTYPGHICTQQSWIFNNAGGAMGQMTLLHASLREYLILFGTGVGTEGHSGRYSAEVFDFVYDGEMWCTLEGQSHRMSFTNGKGAYLPCGRTKQYRIPDHGWMLEYGRGNESIITMFPFGLADSTLSTLDHMVVFRTLYHYAHLVTWQLLTKGKDLDVLFKWILKGILIFGAVFLIFKFLAF
jgi:C-8 sterol isomerase